MHDTLSTSDRSAIVQRLLQWFRFTNRDLPWRRTYNPYHVWISEIMLQQTQMDRGVAYFLRWIERFPDVQAVAESWGTGNSQILGRAWLLRQGQKFAQGSKGHSQGIMAGRCPCDYGQLLSLPGIGPYTASSYCQCGRQL